MRRTIITGIAVILVAVLLIPSVNVPLSVSAVDEVVTFPDSNLEAAIRNAIDKPSGDIYQSDLEGLTSLSASERNITNLSGIQYCANLQQLSLYSNQISNISALSALVNLQYLYLQGNQISNLSPLSSLTSLICLETQFNQISDLSPLSGLTSLSILGLAMNQISDISSLSSLTELKSLYIWGNQISDLSPLSGLTNLTGLDLNDNLISNVSDLASLTNLQSLTLSTNQISDISALSNLTRLFSLTLDNNHISDIFSLSNLTHLNYLWLDHNQISNIEPLVDNMGLSSGDEISLDCNPLSSTSINTYIPIIESRGVSVSFDYSCFTPTPTLTSTPISTPGITVSPTSGLVTTEAGGTATFTIVLNTQPTASVVINLSSSDPTEGGPPPPGSVTFTPTNWATPQTVTVYGFNDAIVDGDVPYTIITAPASSSDIDYNGLNAADVSVTNIDISYIPTSTPTSTPAPSEVTNVSWQVDGQAVTTARIGDTVQATALVTARGGPRSGICIIKIVKDFSLGLDQDYVSASMPINLANGESQNISLTWSPDAASGNSGLRGYYMVLFYESFSIYTMPIDYPPRLTVLPVPASEILVSDAYWQVGSTNVTAAHVNDNVLANAVVMAQGRSISGTYTIKVAKDIAFGSDVDYAQSLGSLNLADGESQTISLSWSPNAASGDGGLRGYYVSVYFNDASIYTMSTGYPPRLSVSPAPVILTPTVEPLPQRFDWREHTTLSPVRDQRNCGSCWAFSAIGAIEGTYAKEHGVSTDLSEQNLVSNCYSIGSQRAGSCLGGWPSMAFNYIESNGIVDEACYPYSSGSCTYCDSQGNLRCSTSCTCGDNSCSYPCACNRCQGWNSELWRITSYSRVTGGVDEVKRALINHGPLSVTSSNWRHAFVLVGYDDNCMVCKNKYGQNGCWIIRNSWGVRNGWIYTGGSNVWHENGYAYIPYTGFSYSDLINWAYYVEGVTAP